MRKIQRKRMIIDIAALDPYAFLAAPLCGERHSVRAAGRIVRRTGTRFGSAGRPLAADPRALRAWGTSFWPLRATGVTGPSCAAVRAAKATEPPAASPGMPLGFS